jgi:hypothetical protein
MGITHFVMKCKITEDYNHKIHVAKNVNPIKHMHRSFLAKIIEIEAFNSQYFSIVLLYFMHIYELTFTSF